jgi:hypothetical protein
MGGIVTHAVVKIANYTTNYDFVDIRRVSNVFHLKLFYALYMRTNSWRWNTSDLKKHMKKERLI